jgi:hypothetical protein
LALRAARFEPATAPTRAPITPPAVAFLLGVGAAGLVVRDIVAIAAGVGRAVAGGVVGIAAVIGARAVATVVVGAGPLVVGAIAVVLGALAQIVAAA